LQIKITELPPEADWYQVLRIEGVGVLWSCFRLEIVARDARIETAFGLFGAQGRNRTYIKINDLEVNNSIYLPSYLP